MGRVIGYMACFVNQGSLGSVREDQCGPFLAAAGGCNFKALHATDICNTTGVSERRLGLLIETRRLKPLLQNLV